MKVGVARADSSPDCCVPVVGASVTSGPRVDFTMGLSVGAAAVGGLPSVGLRWVGLLLVGLRWAHPSALAGQSAKECCPRCSRRLWAVWWAVWWAVGWRSAAAWRLPWG